MKIYDTIWSLRLSGLLNAVLLEGQLSSKLNLQRNKAALSSCQVRPHDMTLLINIGEGLMFFEISEKCCVPHFLQRQNTFKKSVDSMLRLHLTQCAIAWLAFEKSFRPCHYFCLLACFGLNYQSYRHSLQGQSTQNPLKVILPERS